jgi:lauroyl/myristoyl acyltransferase
MAPGNLAFYQYRLLARFAEVLPSRGVRIIGSLAGALGPKMLPSRAALVRSNLRRVTNEEPSSAAVADAFESYVRYWLTAFRLPVVPVEHLESMFSIDGFEHLVAAQQAGKGAILALPHIGNWDVAGAWLPTQGMHITVVAERLEPPKLHQWFTDFRRSLGMSVVVNGPGAGAALSTALKQGEFVGLLCDRDVDSTGGVYEFFGESTTLPKGPATLAFRTGAPLLPVAVYEEGDKFRAVVQEPVDVVRSGSKLSEDVDRVTQELAHRLEQLIRRAPSQWHLFQPNWPSDRK